MCVFNGFRLSRITSKLGNEFSSQCLLRQKVLIRKRMLTFLLYHKALALEDIGRRLFLFFLGQEVKKGGGGSGNGLC